MTSIDLSAYRPDRVLGLTGPVDMPKCTAIARKLIELSQTADEPVLLMIDTGGGQVHAANLLGGVIRLNLVPVTGLALTLTASAGFDILQSCSRRLALPASRLGLHYGSLSFNRRFDRQSDMIAYAELAATRWAAREGRQEDFIARRTGLGRQAVAELLGRDPLLTAPVALELGLIDGIVEGAPVVHGVCLGPLTTATATEESGVSPPG
jgi:ATP-dependent protease ClpP protease subunit